MTRPCSARLIFLKSAVEVTPSSTAGRGAGGRGKGSVPWCQRPPWPGDTVAPHTHRRASRWLRAGSKWHREPKVTLWASCDLPLQAMRRFHHYFPSRAGWKWHTICIQSEKPHFVTRKLRKSFQQAARPRGTCLQELNLSQTAFCRLCSQSGRH